MKSNILNIKEFQMTFQRALKSFKDSLKPFFNFRKQLVILNVLMNISLPSLPVILIGNEIMHFSHGS